MFGVLGLYTFTIVGSCFSCFLSGLLKAKACLLLARTKGCTENIAEHGSWYFCKVLGLFFVARTKGRKYTILEDPFKIPQCTSRAKSQKSGHRIFFLGLGPRVKEELTHFVRSLGLLGLFGLVGFFGLLGLLGLQVLGSRTLNLHFSCFEVAC